MGKEVVLNQTPDLEEEEFVDSITEETSEDESPAHSVIEACQDDVCPVCEFVCTCPLRASRVMGSATASTAPGPAGKKKAPRTVKRRQMKTLMSIKVEGGVRPDEISQRHPSEMDEAALEGPIASENPEPGTTAIKVILCKYEDCDKVYTTMAGLRYHVKTYDHGNLKLREGGAKRVMRYLPTKAEVDDGAIKKKERKRKASASNVDGERSPGASGRDSAVSSPDIDQLRTAPTSAVSSPSASTTPTPTQGPVYVPLTSVSSASSAASAAAAAKLASEPVAKKTKISHSQNDSDDSAVTLGSDDDSSTRTGVVLKSSSSAFEMLLNQSHSDMHVSSLDAVHDDEEDELYNMLTSCPPTPNATVPNSPTPSSALFASGYYSSNTMESFSPSADQHAYYGDASTNQFMDESCNFAMVGGEWDSVY